MGEDKSLLPFGKNNTLLEYQQNRFQIHFSNIYVSAKNNKFDFDTNLILDIDTTYSPLNSIISALVHLKKDIFILAVDYPFFTVQSISIMINFFYKYNQNIVTVRDDKNNIHPLCSVVPYSSLPMLKSLYNKDEHKMKNIVKKLNAKDILIDSKELININYKDEYTKSNIF